MGICDISLQNMSLTQNVLIDNVVSFEYNNSQIDRLRCKARTIKAIAKAKTKDLTFKGRKGSVFI